MHIGLSGDWGARMARVGVLVVCSLMLLAPPASPQAGSAGADGTWKQLTPDGPPGPLPQGRLATGAVYDPIRKRLLVYGGNRGLLPGVWQLNLATGNPAWSVLPDSLPPPIPRFGHVTVHDTHRNRMLVFGGELWFGPLSNEVHAFAMDGSNTWTPLLPAGPGPSPRRALTGNYDPVRDRLLLFGGWDGSAFLDEVWELPLAGTLQWNRIFPVGPGPGVRDLMTGIYDPVADRLIVFGGWTGSEFKNDVWALSLSGTPTWALLTPSGTPPSPRREYMAAYDPLHQRVLYVGGTLPDPPFTSDETWELDLSGPPAWNNLSPAAPTPSARFGGAAVHDPDKDRFLLFGGYDGDYRNDTWGLSLSGATVWEELDVNLPSPTQRFMAAGVLDRPRDRFVIFGGYDLNYRNDVWGLGLSGLDWNELAPVTSPPSGRMVTGTIHDPVRDRMIVFGGHPTFLNDLWAFELGGTPKWSLLPVSAGPSPDPRWGHYAVYDSRRDRLVSFGGITAGGVSNEVWTIPLEGTLTWELLTPGGTSPPPLYLGASIYDPVRDRLVVFGGFGDDTFQNQAWALSFDGTPTWTQLSPAGVPPVGRDLMSGVYDPVRDRMVIFGGWDGALYRDDVWALNFAGGESWIQLAPEGTGPSARREYTAIFDPTRYRMVLFGGTNGSGYHNDVWELQWDAPVSARPSLVSSSASDGRVSIVWYAGSALRSGIVERRQENIHWLELGSTVADGTGNLTYLDDGVPDGRYAYRLKYGSETGLETTDEVWIDVASSDGFGLQGAVPHPARNGALTVDFTVPDDRPVTIELMTAGGRRVLVRELGGLGPGRHRVALASERSIPGGVYWLRASYAGSVRTKRVVVLD